MKFPKLSRNQLLCILLFFAVCVNTYYHFTSPAYKFYQDQFKDFDKKIEDFKIQVRDEFIPTIILLATNSCSGVVVTNNTYNTTVNKSDNSLGVLNGSYFINNGKPYFSYSNLHFSIGDDFFGYPILGISQTTVTTSQGVFYLVNSPYHKDDKEGGIINGRNSIL